MLTQSPLDLIDVSEGQFLYRRMSGAPFLVQDREKVGNIWEKFNIFPMYHLQFPHKFPISTISPHPFLTFPTRIPILVHVSMSFLQSPHSEINIFSTVYLGQTWNVKSSTLCSKIVQGQRGCTFMVCSVIVLFHTLFNLWTHSNFVQSLFNTDGTIRKPVILPSFGTGKECESLT